MERFLRQPHTIKNRALLRPQLVLKALLPLMGILLLCIGQPSAQTLRRYCSNYTTANSLNSNLPTNHIYRLYEDGYGYLWLVSEKGLIGYDGRSFRQIKGSEKRLYVNAYKINDSTLLLFDLFGSIDVFDINTQTLQNLALPPRSSAPKQKPILWQLQQNGHTYLYQNFYEPFIELASKSRPVKAQNSKVHFLALVAQQFGMDAAKLQQMLSAPESNYINPFYKLHVAAGYLYLFNKIYAPAQQGKAQLLLDGTAWGIRKSIIGHTQAGKDLLLAVQDLGLLRLNYFFDTAKKVSVDTLLYNKNITHISTGADGRCWISSSDKGIFLIRQPLQHSCSYRIDDPRSKISFNFAQKIGTHIWVNPSGSNTLALINAQGQLKHSHALPELSNVKQIYPQGKHYLIHCENTLLRSPNLLQGPYKKGSNRARVNLFINDIALYGTRIYKPDNNYVFIYDPYLNLINTIAPTKDFFITAIALADSNRIYISYKNGCTLNNKPLPYLSNTFINRVRLYNGQLYWITNEGVYSIPEKESTDSRRLRKISSFVANNLYDSPHYIYLYNENEWIMMDKNTQEISAGFKMAHFPISGFINSLNTDSTHLIICTDQNIISLPLADIEAYKQTLPKIYFQNTEHKAAITDTSYSSLYQKDYNIVVGVDIIDYGQKDYYSQYRILNNNNPVTNWSSTNNKNDRKINLYEPKPGLYTIEYQLSGIDKEWTIIKRYHIEIKPRWWQTDWFLTICALLILIILGVIIYYIALFYSKKADRKIAQETKIFELESKNTLAQLKPHFIFNAIAPLQAYLINNDKRGGLEYLQQFSTMVRTILLSIRNKSITVAEEIDFLNNYLLIQQKRFNGNLDFQISCSANLNKQTRLIPTMLLQPIVENAIEHGLNRNKPDQKIEIVFVETEQCITITIQDNGKGLPLDFATKANHALEILQEQIEMLRQKKGIGQFKITNRTDQSGVIVHIILPLQNK